MEVDQHLPRLLLLGLLLLLSASFSGSETALCALTRVQVERLRNDKRKSSIAIVSFVEDSRRLFITILLGNTFINTAFATITYSLLRQLPAFENFRESIKLVIGTLVITCLLLIVGEITPKTYAIRYAEKFARITARPLWIFSVLISPLRSILRSIIDFFMPLFGGSQLPQTHHLTAEDFKAIVSTYQGEGIEVDERDILANILELRDIEAKEIMVPRTEMIAVETKATIQVTINQAKEFGVSRIPVYRDRIDNICGVFQVKDLPVWRRANIRSMTIETFLAKRNLLGDATAEDTLVRQPVFVLETKKTADLLAEFTHRKTNMAILLDEYGGTSGIVTIEDIIEEIVGDIVDEHDSYAQSPEIIVHPDNPRIIEVASRVNVRHMNQQFHLKLDEELADTIGGYVLGLLGRVPTAGEFHIDENGIKFEVVAMEENLIGAVIMTLPENE